MGAGGRMSDPPKAKKTETEALRHTLHKPQQST